MCILAVLLFRLFELFLGKRRTLYLILAGRWWVQWLIYYKERRCSIRIYRIRSLLLKTRCIQGKHRIRLLLAVILVEWRRLTPLSSLWSILRLIWKLIVEAQLILSMSSINKMIRVSLSMERSLYLWDSASCKIGMMKGKLIVMFHQDCALHLHYHC